MYEVPSPPPGESTAQGKFLDVSQAHDDPPHGDSAQHALWPAEEEGLGVAPRFALMVLATLCVLLAYGSQAAPIEDPTGDLLAASGPDLTALRASHLDDELIITLELAQAVSAPDSGQVNALFGFIDLDLDRNASTGEVAFVDFLTGVPSDLGNEFYVDFSTYRAGEVDLVRNASAAVVGRVPMTLADRRVTVSLPHALLGSSSTVHTAVVVGGEAAPSDVVPNGGFVASTGATNEGAVLLQNERFAVEVEWRNFEQMAGTGTVAVRSEDTAVFWFFSANNWELMIKVINGCGFNDHFWVFASASTNVEYTLRITDTQTGAVMTYTNPLGTAAEAITDNVAFATCP